MTDFQVDKNLATKVWKKLRFGDVPIVTKYDLDHITESVIELNRKISSNAYMPGVGHGYLGLQKGSGVTRFIPILTQEDMAVYYQMCSLIGDEVLTSEKGIFGGWHSVPKSLQKPAKEENKSFEDAKMFQQGYFIDSFSEGLWFKEFKKFTDLILETTSSADFGNFVLQTDIANFYDSIEVPRLTTRLRNEAPKLEPVIQTLSVFLNFWNRRIEGYHPSTKGIPQEIISDASRILSHYYLQRFDVQFKSYCESLGFQYVRWADDLLVFGSSRSKLEEVAHRASRFLLPDGLNLNASKTKILTRKEFAKYRGVYVLAAINHPNMGVFRRRLKSALIWAKDNDLRIDTIFRATIGFIHKNKAAVMTFEKNFVFETITSHPDLVGTLNVNQLIKLISIYEDPKKMFLYIRSICLNKPFAGPRARFLALLKTKHKQLDSLGISYSLQKGSVQKVLASSNDSEILTTICIPSAIEVLDAY